MGGALTGKVIVITGATGGVGPAVARMALAEGATVTATGRDLASIEALRETLDGAPGRWLSFPADLTEAAAADALMVASAAQHGGLDVVCAIAGGWRGGATVAETDPATLEWLWRINVETAFNTCRAALPYLTERGRGRIITFGAQSAVGGQARNGAYAASKAAVMALTASIAAEVKGTGVTAHCLLPSTIDTAANRASMPNADPGRWVTPEQIAATVRFLCSDEASALNGASIPLSGRG